MKWIKWNTEIPPTGEEILIAMRNKNMDEGGIWLYDRCWYLGGDPNDEDNWEGKENWETPIYWCLIEEPREIEEIDVTANILGYLHYMKSKFPKSTKIDEQIRKVEDALLMSAIEAKAK